MSKAATRPLESQLSTLEKKLKEIQDKVAQIDADLKRKKAQIDKGYEDLTDQEKKFNIAVRDFYIKSYYNFPFLVLLSQNLASDITRVLAYQKKAADEDKRIITNLALSVADLESKKSILENENARLALVKETLASQAAFLDKEVKGAKAYQAKLSSQIAQLSAQQQELVAQRLGSLNIPRSASTTVPACVDDREKDPGFSPRIAFFTYGAPHRVGMNQYGAKGRADAGQGRDDILRAYYANYEVTKWDTNIKIKVQGQREFPLEDYTLRIYEMPESWPMAALEAQAIAARSFALAYTNNGAGEICTSESCQVFHSNPKTEAWAQAVKNTEGLVMTSGGSPIKAWYASTHGGYVFTSAEVWGGGTSYTKHVTDTTTGTAGSFSELQSNAYDRESPWFYCDWGARGDKKTAWLRSEEVADIINVILLARADSSTKDHFYQTDKQHPYGGEVWKEDQVKSELRSRNITPYNSISDISVSVDFGKGATSTVNITGDAGSQSLPGSEFKDWFNLRAPANIQIVGPLYNVERK